MRIINHLMQTPVIPIFDGTDYEAQVRRAGQLLREGRIVVLPTETVYGAAGLLTSAEARSRLRGLRPHEVSPKPLTIHLADRSEAQQFLGEVSELGTRMMKKLWPGPVGLTFDVPQARRREVAARFGVDESEIYDGSSITLRCPDHIVALDILGLAGGPVVAVRAGIGANQTAQRADQVSAELDGKVDLIVDAGTSRYSKPSTLVKVNITGYEVVREGVYDQRIIERLLRTTVLFVCSGNTCRSPMAEALARKLISEKLKVSESDLEKKGISVLSAGCAAMTGSRATPAAVEAVKSFGADLSRHRSRPLTVELIHQADAVYTMGRAHAMQVLSLVPSAMEKVRTLAPDQDIDDPIGGDLALYVELAGELRYLIEQRLEENKLP